MEMETLSERSKFAGGWVAGCQFWRSLLPPC